MAHTHTLLWSSFSSVRRVSLHLPMQMHLLLSSGRSSYFRMMSMVMFFLPFTFYLSSCWRRSCRERTSVMNRAPAGSWMTHKNPNREFTALQRLWSRRVRSRVRAGCGSLAVVTPRRPRPRLFFDRHLGCGETAFWGERTGRKSRGISAPPPSLPLGRDTKTATTLGLPEPPPTAYLACPVANTQSY